MSPNADTRLRQLASAIHEEGDVFRGCGADSLMLTFHDLSQRILDALDGTGEGADPCKRCSKYTRAQKQVEQLANKLQEVQRVTNGLVEEGLRGWEP